MTTASTSHLRNLTMAPRKLAVVVDLVRGKPVGDALNLLQWTKRAAARPVRKLIESAVANASDLSKGQIDVDTLWIQHISVDQGPTTRRFMPRAMGRANRINKKTSHVHVVLSADKRKKK